MFSVFPKRYNKTRRSGAPDVPLAPHNEEHSYYPGNAQTNDERRLGYDHHVQTVPGREDPYLAPAPLDHLIRLFSLFPRKTGGELSAGLLCYLLL